MAHILPNDIIMRIIREADGGRNTHEEKWEEVDADIWITGHELDKQGDDEFGRHGFCVDQLFRQLWENDALTKTAIKRRRNQVR